MVRVRMVTRTAPRTQVEFAGAYEAPGGFVGLATTALGVVALRFAMHSYHEALESLGVMRDMNGSGRSPGGTNALDARPAPPYVADLVDDLRAMLSGRNPGWTVRIVSGAVGVADVGERALPVPGEPPLLPGEPPRTYPVDLSWSTPFQAEVYRVTAGIPWGQTRSYAWVAGAAGRPGAARAVGGAMRSNPVPLLIPCHRVVRSDGGIGGYGGETRGPATVLKARLVAMEREGAAHS